MLFGGRGAVQPAGRYFPRPVISLARSRPESEDLEFDMTETSEHQETTAARIRRRLFASRWLLAASTVAILAVAARPSFALALGAIAAVAGVAAFAPRRPVAIRNGGRTLSSREGVLARIAAEDVAAAVPDPLVVFDAGGALVHANQAAEAAFGPLASGISLQLKFRAPEMQELVEKIVAGRAPSGVVDYTERVPVERVFRVVATSIGNGERLFALVFKDQSEVRRIDRMRADFIANASHELRTPLASIAGFVETLRGPARNDPAARDHFLQIMQNQTSRMARLIDDLLSLSRLEMKPYLRPGARLDVGQVLQSVVDSLAPLAADSGVVIEKRLADAIVEVAGDRDELFQVFENLLENAIKYGQSGGKVVVSIEETAQAGRREIEVTFRDFGPGIPEEHIPRVTERFYRVDVETSRAQKGTGLGLAIVKHILTRHNARLSIRSRVGEGAAFTAHFPAL
jgi:two-component system phosphate regulon sensor histidine kinase PhoR